VWEHSWAVTASEHPDETTAGLRDTPPGPRGRAFRYAGFAVLSLVVLAAALGLLGPRTEDTTVRAAGYTLTVEYTQLTRAGQPAPLNLRVASSTSLPQVVQVRLCDELFDDLDFQNWYPNPSVESAAPRAITYEFEAPPAGNTLEVSLDARTAPGQFGEVRDCEVSVLEDDTPVLSTTFTTWRMP
jgi:hypothetical protein